jgi:hypothetical protein
VKWEDEGFKLPEDLDGHTQEAGVCLQAQGGMNKYLDVVLLDYHPIFCLLFTYLHTCTKGTF